MWSNFIEIIIIDSINDIKGEENMLENCLEIEKKYLVKSVDEVKKHIDLTTCKSLKIEQGYLCNNPTIRIRKFNEEYCITYKSRGADNKDDNVIVNNEVELPLTKESYEKLLRKIDYSVVEKTRYIIPLKDGLKAELDIFEGKLKGLILVEVEFETKEMSKNFVEPMWFGDNVSSDRRYKNLFLAQIDSIELL